MQLLPKSKRENSVPYVDSPRDKRAPTYTFADPFARVHYFLVPYLTLAALVFIHPPLKPASISASIIRPALCPAIIGSAMTSRQPEYEHSLVSNQPMATQHSHDGLGPHSLSHEFKAAEHGHSHEILDGPGSYTHREMPIITGRDWNERAFTVGIGG